MIVTSYGQPDSSGSIASVQSNPFSTAQITNNNLQSFENDSINNGVGQYSQGNTSSVNLGFDPATGIAWGRWYNGSAQFTDAAGNTINLNLSNNSLHWIASPDQASTIALPSSGTAEYNWVGNTSPTDNLGNTGILGNATLQANFTDMTVDSAVAIGINDQVWNANANAMPIGANGSFGGPMDSVEVNTGGGIINGSGEAAGFFTNNADGAGLGFALEADINNTPTSVSGSAVFSK